MSQPEMLKMIIAIFGFIVTIGLAIWKYRIEQMRKQKTERLVRIDEQLKQLYGPLYSLLTARRKAWEIFATNIDLHQWIRGHNFEDQYIPTEYLDSWKNWIRYESREANELISDIILQNTHLIIEDSMPSEFEDFFVHFSQYRFIMNRWDNGQNDILFANLPFPEEKLRAYIDSSFLKLKRTQYQILGHQFPLIGTPLDEEKTIIPDKYENLGSE